MVEPVSEVETLSEFRKGARAMHDYLLSRAANNYHGNPITNQLCQDENILIEEWAADALAEVSPEDYEEWTSINQAYERGKASGLYLCYAESPFYVFKESFKRGLRRFFTGKG